MKVADWARGRRLFEFVEPAVSPVQTALWRLRGNPDPPPSPVKRSMLVEFGKRHRLRTLVETGTYKADTVRCLRHSFDAIFSIEMDEGLFAKAVQRCHGQSNASLFLGDSTYVLPEILERLDEPALFWLDAHYSGGTTAAGTVETPILAEAKAVLGNPIRGHVILIDDCREFARGAPDYPPIERLQALAEEAKYSIEMRNDVICMSPDESG